MFLAWFPTKGTNDHLFECVPISSYVPPDFTHFKTGYSAFFKPRAISVTQLSKATFQKASLEVIYSTEVGTIDQGQVKGQKPFNLALLTGKNVFSLGIYPSPVHQG